jgi:hypothetical protein
MPCGMTGALAAVEASLGEGDQSACTIREFGAQLICALAESNWHRARLHDAAKPAALFDALYRAVDFLDVVVVKKQAEPTTTTAVLTEEQERYVDAPITPKTEKHDLLIVRAYAGTGTSPRDE